MCKQPYRVKTFGAVAMSEASGKALSVPHKLLIIIAMLASTETAKLPRSRVIRSLWGEDQTRADASFRQMLVKARRILGDNLDQILLIEPSTLRLDTTKLTVDFRFLLCADEQLPDDDLALVLRDMPAGEFLGDTQIEFADYQDWYMQTRSLIQLRLVSFLTDKLQTAASRASSFRYAQALIEADPSKELGYRVLMEHYCDDDDRSAARDVYRRCQSVLMANFGVEPELTTRQLAVTLGLASHFPEHDDRVQGAPGVPALAASNVISMGVPRLVVLAPRLLTQQSESRDVIEALLDDVSVGLTRFRSVTVLAGHTGRQIGTGYELSELRSRYGVRYALKTDLLPGGERPKISIKLYDVEGLECLYGTSSSLDMDRLPELFDIVSGEIARRLVTSIEQREINISSACPVPSAYRSYLQGRRDLWKSDLPYLRRARGAFKAAIREADSYAPGYSGLSRAYSMERLVRGMSDNGLLHEALDLADRAIRIDPLDGRGFCQRGFCNLYLKRHDDSLSDFASAVSLNPNDADTQADYADALSHSGYPQDALAAIQRAKALNPEWPIHYDWIHASILYQVKRYADSIELLRKHDSSPGVTRLLAASYAMAGYVEQSNAYAKQFRDSYPDFDPDSTFDLIPDKNAYDLQHLVEGMKKAGIA
jgi:DNA-binding SARP family transcriptional activator/tetratricopeptide (TPR) repeat protein